MAIIGIREALYLKKHLNEVKHVTLNPNGLDVLRIHMVPPRRSLKSNIPSAIVVNGQDIVPVNLSWAILLSAFIDTITPYDSRDVSQDDWALIIDATIKKVRAVYPAAKAQTFKDDLWTIIDTLTEIAQGKKPRTDIGQISIWEYADHMKAPHRMDLMISSMTKEDVWNCNQKCLHCYAAGQPLATVEELSTHSWRQIIDKCRRAGIPQITFTGGEPTLRDDLVELVEHSRWFITRLNTNGVLLTQQLCDQLYKASLDSVQVTLYSADPEKHNRLVGVDNWTFTIAGIKNALASHLNVSVNTPLCTINSDYTETLKLAHELGIRFVSCSGLIIAGNAREPQSVDTQLKSSELNEILKSAYDYCQENDMDISFTSPGWISEKQLLEIGNLTIPSCGACLSNMAITPDGNVVPCQSWLSGESLGNMLEIPWEKIWDNPRCREIRKESGRLEHRCPLRAMPYTVKPATSAETLETEVPR